MTLELILHEYSASGNCYKVRLTAAYLGLPLERREYDISKGETRTPAFLAGAARSFRREFAFDELAAHRVLLRGESPLAKTGCL